MSMRKIWATRVGTTTAEEYTGSRGTIFFNELTGALRISDGVTVGGQPLTLVSSDFQFQFGDFVATTEIVAPFGATLMSAKTNQDINIVSNGTGEVNVIGEFSIHRTDGSIADVLAEEPIFRVSQLGQMRVLVPTPNSTTGAVEIVGSDSGEFQTPVQSGVMLHVTGQLSDEARVYIDGNNGYSIIVGRRYNGTATAPTAVSNNDIIVRYGANAYNGVAWNTGGVGRMEINATENHDTGGQGTNLKFYTTANRSTSPAARLMLDAAGATIQGTGKFIGGLTGKADTAGTADIATTVTLTATNSTAATHYLTFVDSATGNENVRTDTDLTYNLGTNTLFVPRLQSKLYRYSRDAGTIAADGTLTLDFSVDDVVYCVWGDGMNIAYQNFTAGSVIRLMARKATGTGVDTVNLDGVTAANISTGATTTPNVSADTTLFIEFTCIGTTIGTVYIKL